MSTSVPDGISFADLEALAKDAPNDFTIVPTEGPYAGLNEEELKDLVNTWLENMHETNGHPMFAKAIVWRILSNMIDWHTGAGQHQFEEGDPESAVFWLRDAGKFQAMANLLQTINIGPNDFITPVE